MESDAYQSWAPSSLAEARTFQVEEREPRRSPWSRVERYAAGAQIAVIQAGGSQLRLLSGWACEMRILPDGRRQIFTFLLPGDVVETRGFESLGSRAIVALSRLQAVRAESDEVPWVEHSAQQREQRLYDHMVRMGQLSAKERVIHLLLELYDRLERVGLVDGDTFKVPLTQEVFADALGLSVVHINRTLRCLRRDDWVVIKSGSVTLKNRRKLESVACYRTDELSKVH